MLVISSYEIAKELFNEKVFCKSINGAQNQVRNGLHGGLFTARHREPSWELAHRVLMPAFGPLNIKEMFPEMLDIASQLVLKWARYGPKNTINTTADFTRLTLDSIARE